MQEEKSPDTKLSHVLKNLSFGGNLLGWEPVKSSLELLGFLLKNPGTLERETPCLWLKKRLSSAPNFLIQTSRWFGLQNVIA